METPTIHHTTLSELSSVSLYLKCISTYGAGLSASPPATGSKRPRSPSSGGESSGAARRALHLLSGPKQLPEGLAACLRARGWEVDEMDSGSVPGHSNDLLRNWSNGSEETTCLF